jgi:hypothetical protein
MIIGITEMIIGITEVIIGITEMIIFDLKVRVLYVESILIYTFIF